MRALLRSLLVPGDPITGSAYFSWGVSLFILKYFIDAALARIGFGVEWMPTDYFLPRSNRLQPGVNAPAALPVFLVMWALPFIWIGVNLTIRRLRTLGWPPLLACVFFVPFANLIFFATLVCKSARSAEPPATAAPTKPSFESPVWIAVTVGVLCTGLAILATVVLESYGWGLFVGVPFFTGFIPALVYSGRERPSFRKGIRMMLMVQTFIFLCLLLIALEGVICLAMAAPIAIGIGMIGVSFGLAVRNLSAVSSQRSEIASASFLLLPILMLGESRMQMEPTLFEVTSSIEVDAPPERVWKSVVTFSELPPPTELIFRAGLAYPIRAEIKGSGVGAIRHCVFSTGPFVEPITEWSEPVRLRFSVTSNPPPMRELSFTEVNPPHLHGFLESEQGQFELKRLPRDRTQLIGTTWYRHGLWPEAYWRIWSDHIIHTIQIRVLRHIRSEVEGSVHNNLASSNSAP
jgi:hypothetical protein